MMLSEAQHVKMLNRHCNVEQKWGQNLATDCTINNELET